MLDELEMEEIRNNDSLMDQSRLGTNLSSSCFIDDPDCSLSSN
jgi:hypothetical protein